MKRTLGRRWSGASKAVLFRWSAWRRKSGERHRSQPPVVAPVRGAGVVLWCVAVTTVIASAGAGQGMGARAQAWQDTGASTGEGPVRMVPISVAPLGAGAPPPVAASALAVGTPARRANALSTGCQYSGTLIQTALDAAYAAGGGTVYAALGVYCIDDPLIVRSNVYLIGAGVGATVVAAKPEVTPARSSTAPRSTPRSRLWPRDGASIRDLTVDHATNGTYANGVELIPDGANFGGTPSSNCVVENVQSTRGQAISIPTRFGTCVDCTTRS